MLFKKPKPNPPSKAQLADDFHAKLGKVVADGFAAGLDVYDVVGALNTRVSLIRACWTATAPLGGRIP